ncbi:ankyrin-3-like [Haliotis cracherodii]|uniref:ankyrin-3-like n=1 Tax=Haliotis cracherodii TaxID=6455 RepID=UPI0039EC60E7
MGDEDWLPDEEFRILSRGAKEKVYLKIKRRSGLDTLRHQELEAASDWLPFEKRQDCTRAGSIPSQEPAADTLPINLDFALTHRTRDRDRRPFSSMAEIGGGYPDSMRSPLCMSVETGIPSAVESLLNAGYDINCKDSDGNSPLHVAIFSRFYDITKLLLRHGCVLGVYNKAGFTPLHVAVLHRDEHALSIICNYQRIHGNAGGPIAPDHYACPAIDLRALFSGETCLHIAVEQNNLEIVKILVQEGASVDAVNYYSQTPLVLACRYNYHDITKVLLNYSANPNVTGSFGNQRNTPLGLAAKYNYYQLARVLVDHGADVNLRDDSGPSPLFTALLCESEDVATFFLTECPEKGLDVTVSRRNGETTLHALMSFKGEKRTEFARILVKGGCPVNQANRARQFPLHEAVARYDRSMVSTLMDLGADMHVFDRWGQNALHIAVAIGQLDTTKLLLASGADMDSQTSSGRTSLFLALDQGHFNIAEFLILHGCDLTLEPYLLAPDSPLTVRPVPESRKKPPFALSADLALLGRLQTQASGPCCLFVLSVRRIRQWFTKLAIPLNNTYDLPIPLFLQRFLCYNINRKSDLARPK